MEQKAALDEAGPPYDAGYHEKSSTEAAFEDSSDPNASHDVSERSTPYDGLAMQPPYDRELPCSDHVGGHDKSLHASTNLDSVTDGCAPSSAYGDDELPTSLRPQELESATTPYPAPHVDCTDSVISHGNVNYEKLYLESQEKLRCAEEKLRQERKETLVQSEEADYFQGRYQHHKNRAEE